MNISEKSMKKKIILNIINHFKLISRTTIQELTDIRLATITELTKELMSEDIIIESGRENIKDTKRKKLLRLNEKKFYIIGIDIQANKIILLITDFNAKVLESIESKIEYDYTKQQIIDVIFNSIKHMILKYGKSKILGIGIANPGILDRDRERNIVSSQLENWQDVSIKSIIEDEFDLPVCVEDSAVLNILCEKWFGSAKDFNDVIYVQLGVGIGVSIIANGNIIKGYSGVAGELGHTLVESNGLLCVCGNYGCLQTVASSKVIVNKVKNMLEKGASSIISGMVEGNLKDIDINIITKAAKLNDKIAFSVLNEAGTYIGIALSTTINLLNPQLLIFGGEMVKENDFIIEPIKRIIRSNALPFATNEIIFKVSEIKENGGALGAVALILDNFFDYTKLKNFGILDCLNKNVLLKHA
ncbi:MAG: ROK family protein [Actinobacteria bacterium]|nr:ROK family protein [Actinomycetota bacterium]